MDTRNVFLISLLIPFILPTISAQHEDIPYQDVTVICDACACSSAKDSNNNYHHLLNCSSRNFTHILARWPSTYGINHKGAYIVSVFSNNKITLLQQLPATNATITFSCRNCGIRDIQEPTFMDTPNIIQLDLSRNELTADVLSASVFRGPYKTTGYEPIALRMLNLSHNKINVLEKGLFEHTPNITQLDLGYNKLNVMDTSTALAISLATTLQYLDLSHNEIETLPPIVFKKLINLRTFVIRGNKLKVVPPEISLIGRTLESLSLADNPISNLSEEHFNGLKVLKRLELTSMPALTTIENGTFTHLESLEYLICSRNPKLISFDVDGLLHTRNLTYLDVSECKLETVNINMNLSDALPSNFAAHWPKLRALKVNGNPWICDCKLMRILEFCGLDIFKNDQLARCHSPFGLTGMPIANLTSSYVCDLPKEYILPDKEEPPKFLRRRFIVLTLATIVVVIGVGLLIGYLTVCMRRRLKRDDYGIAPIRYTSVRNSNQSAVFVTK